jgi:hypothetical protein
MRLFDGYIDRRPLMERDGSGVSALVGLDGFVVCAQLLDGASGEWWLAVETTEDRAWCPRCGVRAVGHGRRRVVVRDLPLADRPVVLVWAKRIWRCPEPACPTGTWSEESDQIAPRADPALAPHPADERGDRGHQPGHQEHQAARLRVPELRQLPAPDAPALWSPMADSPCRINTTPPTTLQRVEPDQGQSMPASKCSSQPPD